jgi:hypothetical protein
VGSSSTAIATNANIHQVAKVRDEALLAMEHALTLLGEGHASAQEAIAKGARAHMGAWDGMYKCPLANERLTVSASGALERFRRGLDSRIWMSILIRLHLDQMMDAKALKEFKQTVSPQGDVPPFTVDNALATFQKLMGDRELIFQRGLARAFIELDRRFKSHDGFKIGRRIILTKVFNDYGSWNCHHEMQRVLQDVERVFAVLDGKTPNPVGLVEAIDSSIPLGSRPCQGEAEGDYFRIRVFKNGNAHLWFTQNALLAKVNGVLADYYGEVLPDAAPHPDDAQPADLLTRDVSTNLQFYPTPPEVMDFVLRLIGEIHIPINVRILEPSAGEGNMCRALLAMIGDCCTEFHKGRGKVPVNPHVHAIEVEPGRVLKLQALSRELGCGFAFEQTSYVRLPPHHPFARPRTLTVEQANFLTVLPVPVYDLVVMNPPFYGTHWMAHVMHAHQFLKAGGVLMAVLPATAQFGETKRHKAFRKWAAPKTRYGKFHPDAHDRVDECLRQSFTDLPLESFASSGTRVSTGVLTLWKNS